MRSPMLVLACAFAFGILLVRGTQGGWWWLLGSSGACLAAGLVALTREWMRAAAALALAGFALAGAANARLFAHRFSSSDIIHLRQWGYDPGTPLEVEGSLLMNPLRTPYGLQFDLAVARVTLPG